MKKKLLLIASTVAMAVMIVFGTVACGDVGSASSADGDIDGTYYLSIFNGSDAAAYIYEECYIKIENGICEYSLGWKGCDPIVCSYTVTNETYGYPGKRIVFNINEIIETDGYVSRYKSELGQTYIWNNGVLRSIGTNSEIQVEYGELYNTYNNRTYCKKGIKPDTYARGYFKLTDGNKVGTPPASPVFLVDGDIIKNGSRFHYSEYRYVIDNSGDFQLEIFEVNGTCRVSDGIIEFKDEDGDVFMYGKVSGRVLYVYSDKTDMSNTSWSGRYYRYNTETDIDPLSQYSITVKDSAAIAELDSSNKQ